MKTLELIYVKTPVPNKYRDRVYSAGIKWFFHGTIVEYAGSDDSPPDRVDLAIWEHRPGWTLARGSSRELYKRI